MFIIRITYFKQGLLFILLFLSYGCSSIHYSQSMDGQIEIIRKSKNINEILLDKNTPQALKDKLSTVKQIREFLVKELGLPDNNSYLEYTDIGREYVVWSIFVGAEFSVEPEQSYKKSFKIYPVRKEKLFD